jgi:hypothetical protein
LCLHKAKFSTSYVREIEIKNNIQYLQKALNWAKFKNVKAHYLNITHTVETEAAIHETDLLIEEQPASLQRPKKG